MSALKPGCNANGEPYKILPTTICLPRKETMRKNGEVIFKPTTKQAQCLRILPACREVFFGGAAGGGKTYLMLAALTIWLKHPSFKAVVMRLEWSQIKHFHGVAESLYFPLGATFHGTNKIWTFPSGAEIHYGIFATSKHENKYRGAYYNVVCWDEFGDWHTMDYMQYMFTRIRYTQDKEQEKLDKENGLIPLPALQFFTGNPGGINHARLRKRFRIPDAPKDIQIIKVLDKETGKYYLRAFVPSRLQDNPHLDDEYEERQRASGRHPAIIRAILEGRWDLSIGGAFVEQWDDRKHICEPFEIPADWSVWRGIDDGFNPDPFVSTWITQDPVTTRFYVIDEFTMYKGLPSHLAPEIKTKDLAFMQDKEGRHIRHPLAGVADSSIFQADNCGGGYGRGDKLNIEGLNLTPVKKGAGSRVARAQLMRQLLSPMADGLPGIRFFKGKTPGLVESLPILPSDKLNPEDVDTHGPDHWYDALTYGLIGKPWQPSKLTNNVTR